MLYSFQQKNIFIIPLAHFIQFNKKIAGERLANLHGKSFNELLDSEEQLEEHEEFCEKLLNKMLFSQLVADFNLGNKSKQAFISEALSLLKLPSDKAEDFESAWNSLLEFDIKSLDVFQTLIKLTEQGKSIYLIGKANELHAQRILDLFKKNYYQENSLLENLPEPMDALPLAIMETPPSPSHGNLYLCLSYFYHTLLEEPAGFLTKLFIPQSYSGLLTQLLAYLTTQNKTKEEILLINPYQTSNAITKKLALDTISKDSFYSELRNLARETLASRLAPIPESSSSSEYISLSVHS